MASESLTIDAVSEDAANIAFELSDATTGSNLDANSPPQYPAPDRDPMTAGSADTEGDPYIQSRYRNRTITVPVRLTKTTATALDTLVGQLQSKVGKLAREGGTLKRTLASTNVIVFDVLDCDIEVPADWTYVQQNTVLVTLKFTCKPFGRGSEQTLGAISGTGDVATVYTGIKGDVPALGRVLIIEVGTADQWYAQWGVRSRYYSSGTTSSLAFEAETLLPQGGAAVATLAGASGGTAILQGTLTTSYQSMMSMAKAAGTVYPQHIGDYNFWARLYRPTTNAGTVSVALEYAEGDFSRFTRNAAVVYDADEREGSFTLANLGQVHLSKVVKGSQRWDGRVISKSSTLGDDIYVDRVWLQPISESAGEVVTSTQFQTPTAFSARDEFDQTAGNLAAKVAPVGGTWALGTGSATDWTVDATNHVAQRTATTDSAPGRIEVLGSTSFAACIVQCDVKFTGTLTLPNTESLSLGVIARYVDASNWLSATVGPSAVRIDKKVAGVSSTIASLSTTSGQPYIATGTNWTVRLVVNADGTFALWRFLAGGASPSAPLLLAKDADLATGGALASGKPGLLDSYPNSAAITRIYDNFFVAVPSTDAAVFSLKQAELRNDGFIRQDSAGAVWAEKTVEGDYLRFPPAGREARSAELFFRLSRGDPNTMFDSALDPVSGTAYATPLYLNVPAP